MPLDQQTILAALNQEVAEFVATRAREAAGHDEVKLQWWFLNFGIAWADHGLQVRDAVAVADDVLEEQPLPPLDFDETAAAPRGAGGVVG